MGEYCCSRYTLSACWSQEWKLLQLLKNSIKTTSFCKVRHYCCTKSFTFPHFVWIHIFSHPYSFLSVRRPLLVRESPEMHRHITSFPFFSENGGWCMCIVVPKERSKGNINYHLPFQLWVSHKSHNCRRGSKKGQNMGITAYLDNSLSFIIMRASCLGKNSDKYL